MLLVQSLPYKKLTHPQTSWISLLYHFLPLVFLSRVISFFSWHQTNILPCNFTLRSIPLALSVTAKSSAIAKLSFAATRRCPVLMMLASSLTILGMHLQSIAQHCSSYTLFSDVSPVLVTVCCNISSSLCHSWSMLTLKKKGGQSAFCRLLFLQHIGFLTKSNLSLDLVIPPPGNSESSSKVYHGNSCICDLCHPQSFVPSYYHTVFYQGLV